VNTGIKKIYISFLIFLVTTIALGGQSSLGKVNFTSSVSSSAGNVSDNNDQSNGQNSLMSVNQTSNLSTIHSNTLKKLPQLDQKFSNQNQTGEETSKPSFSTKHQFNAQILSQMLGEFKVPTQKKIGPLIPLQPVLPSNYKITVNFDSVTVHDDHEGVFSGDGEYDLAVYVQGKKISLTDAGGSGGGLWDVSSGETVTFPPGTAVTVDVPGNLPLSIFTVGSEVDGCDRTAFPDDIKSIIVSIFTSTNPADWAQGVMNIHNYLEGRINWVECKLNPNDSIGAINNLYDPTAYGAGSHEEKSDSGDFTLRYSIDVTPPLPITALQK
jgi:hypothetical protein